MDKYYLLLMFYTAKLLFQLAIIILCDLHQGLANHAIAYFAKLAAFCSVIALGHVFIHRFTSKAFFLPYFIFYVMLSIPIDGFCIGPLRATNNVASLALIISIDVLTPVAYVILCCLWRPHDHESEVDQGRPIIRGSHDVLLREHKSRISNVGVPPDDNPQHRTRGPYSHPYPDPDLEAFNPTTSRRAGTSFEEESLSSDFGSDREMVTASGRTSNQRNGELPLHMAYEGRRTLPATVYIPPPHPQGQASHLETVIESEIVQEAGGRKENERQINPRGVGRMREMPRRILDYPSVVPRSRLPALRVEIPEPDIREHPAFSRSRGSFVGSSTLTRPHSPTTPRTMLLDEKEEESRMI